MTSDNIVKKNVLFNLEVDLICKLEKENFIFQLLQML